MPRPELSDDVLRDYQARYDKWIEEHPYMEDQFSTANKIIKTRYPNFRPCDQFELYISGLWLEEKLAELGGFEDKASRDDITFANGQKCMYFEDPWEATLDTLKEVKSGVIPKSGLELAETLHKKYHHRLEK